MISIKPRDNHALLQMIEGLGDPLTTQGKTSELFSVTENSPPSLTIEGGTRKIEMLMKEK